MRTVVHLIKISAHIKNIATIVHQRNVDGRPTAVIGSNRHIDDVLGIRARIPQHRLRLLGAIRVIHDKLQARQLRDTDAFSQRGYRLAV